MQRLYRKIKRNEADLYTNSMVETFSVDLNKEMARDFSLDVKGAAQTDSLQRLSGWCRNHFKPYMRQLGVYEFHH
jgi:hypothetical protein